MNETIFPEKMSDEEIKLTENLLNLLGAFDNPITKRKVGNEFSQTAIQEAKDTLTELGVVSPLLK